MTAGGRTDRLHLRLAAEILGMIMSDFVPNDESAVPTTAPKQRLPTCQYLAQGTAIRWLC